MSACLSCPNCGDDAAPGTLGCLACAEGTCDGGELHEIEPLWSEGDIGVCVCGCRWRVSTDGERAWLSEIGGES